MLDEPERILLRRVSAVHNNKRLSKKNGGAWGTYRVVIPPAWTRALGGIELVKMIMLYPEDQGGPAIVITPATKEEIRAVKKARGTK